jgi:beta-lactam-binding protein with PASTA domain
LALLLFGLVLVGPLAFALGLFESFEATGSGGGEDQSYAKDAANLVQVPELYGSTTAQSDLAAVGLELGRQDEAPNDTIPIGVVSTQDPAERTEVEEGTAVDIVVSKGPSQSSVKDEKERERQRQEQEKEKEKKQQEEEKRRERGE